MINSIANDIDTHARDGYQFLPDSKILKILMFADDLTSMANTPGGLQSSIDILSRSAENLGLKINLEKTKIIVHRKGVIYQNLRIGH